jgi:antitoxin (DNA-binding transcriptional repressor) of toxin-antitoxin stability system
VIVIDVDETPCGLAALLELIEAGQEVVLARRGVQVARLDPIEPARRVPGSWCTVPGWASFRHDPAILAPMDDREIEAEGRA